VRRALVASVLLAALTRPVAATPYETFIDVDDQSDLDDLLAAGDITQDTYDELQELLGNGVDINTADRAELYALPNLTYDDVDKIIAFRDLNKGVIADPAALVAAGALSQEKLLALSAFILISERGDKYAVKGWARLATRFSPRDSRIPGAYLRGRFTALKHLQAGFAAVFTRLEVGAPQYDPNRDALISDPEAYRVRLPKVFAKWEDEEATLIGGTFRAGFGQRLVFDNSSHYTPNGLYSDDNLFFSTDLVSDCRQSAGELAISPCSGDAGNRYITPDFNWRDGLFGVGAGFKHLDAGEGWLQGYVWSSASRRGIYQYELVERSAKSGDGKCIDPSDDANLACAAPTVFVRPSGQNLLTPTPRFSFETLPDVFQEQLAGANVAYFADRRNSIGLTVYGAREQNLVSGINLDTQEWSHLPIGGRFGAAGANFSFGRNWLDIFGEAAYSYDKMPDTQGPAKGGGGPAAILRVTATKKKEELEAVFRYYSIDYVNPFARPISQPDELDGQRARDELGVRLRYYKTQKRFTLRALLDLWEPPSQREPDSVLKRSQPKLDSYVRADVRTTDELRLGLWMRYQDKDLRAGGHDQCFEVPTDTNEDGEPVPCAGRQLTSIGHIQYFVDKTLNFTLMLEHQLLDDNSTSASSTAFRQDVQAWLVGLWRPDPGIRVRGRVRYLNEAIADPGYLETSISALVDAAFTVRRRDLVRVRLDYKKFLDERASTAVRDPNPEFQVWLSYEARL
jgi:hypothetical protein